MSFLLMNLFTPTAARAVNAGASAKADSQAGGNATGDGAAFSAMLANAKDRIGVTKAAPVEALKTPVLDAATAQAIKQPVDIVAALKDAALSEQQLNELRASLRDALNAEQFAGDEQAEQAFQELHDQLEIEPGEAGVEVVDIEAIVMQLPTVVHANAQPRNELLTRIAQFIQTTLGGKSGSASSAPETAKQTQLSHASTRTDPLLEVVQASMFPAEAARAASALSNSQGEAEPLITLAASDIAREAGESDVPRWVRDIAPSKPAVSAEDEGDIYRGLALPELNLPGSEEPVEVQPETPADDVFSAADATVNTALAGSAGTVPVGAVVTTSVVASEGEKPVVDVAPAAAVSAASEPGADLPEQKNVSDQADTALDAAEPAVLRGEANHAAAVKPAKQAAPQAEIAIKAAPAAPREVLAPLPDKSAGDVALELVRNDAALATHAPTHTDKLASTAAAHRSVNASLYQHRAEVVEQVHVAITRANKAEMDRITIQLEPADLGRVDVMMELRRDGTTQLVVAAERRETLDMLQRDARSLERALQEAGVKADAGSMEFNLRQQHGQTAAFGDQQQGSGQSHGGNASATATYAGEGESAQSMPDVQIISSATYTVDGGLNVIV